MTTNEALEACVQVLGGSKQVGPRLWPDKPMKASQTLLLNSLNENRPERLTPEQVVQIFKWARDIGCHVGMEHMAAELDYAKPVPIEPIDKLADLQRQFIFAVDRLAEMADQIKQLQGVQRPLRSIA